MRESLIRGAENASSPRERLFRKGRPIPAATPISKFGTVVRALWRDKPALNLAQRMGVTERNALQIINGERKVTARALAAVINEVL
jgi:hypothetical protein